MHYSGCRFICCENVLPLLLIYCWDKVGNELQFLRNASYMKRDLRGVLQRNRKVYSFIHSFIFHFISLQVQPKDVEIVIKCCTVYLKLQMSNDRIQL
jgi:hypothetical protein